MIRLLALAAIFVLTTAPALAAAPSLITVTAEGRAATMPDMATATFSIATNAATADAATSDNNSRYNRLLQALTRLGIAKTDVSTSSFSVNYNPPPKPPETPQQGQRYGYSVYRGISVTVHRLAQVGKVVDEAVGAGVTDVNGVSFDTSQKSAQFAQALRDAVHQARTHAQAMAAAAGLRLVRVKEMQEGAPAVIRPMASEVFKAAPAVPTQIEPSAVETRATVTVTYEAQ